MQPRIFTVSTIFVANSSLYQALMILIRNMINILYFKNFELAVLTIRNTIIEMEKKGI